MEPDQKAFLQKLLAAPGTSSFESRPAAVWREQAESYGAQVSTDTYGNGFASFGSGTPKVMLAGHIDEIGLILTYIDDEGLLYFKGVGGWDSQQLVGQRVRVVGFASELVGVIGKKTHPPDEPRRPAQGLQTRRHVDRYRREKPR